MTGVFQSAVRQVLNRNDSPIPKGKRRCVLDVIDRLGYVPNTLAQSLDNFTVYLYNRIS